MTTLQRTFPDRVTRNKTVILMVIEYFQSDTSVSSGLRFGADLRAFFCKILTATFTLILCTCCLHVFPIPNDMLHQIWCNDLYCRLILTLLFSWTVAFTLYCHPYFSDNRLNVCRVRFGISIVVLSTIHNVQGFVLLQPASFVFAKMLIVSNIPPLEPVLQHTV